MRSRYFLGLALVVGLFAGRAPLAHSPATVDFQRDVQPILRQNCYGCHGPTQQMNGFRLDRRRDAMRGGTIAVIGPGNSDGSRLYLRLIGNQYGVQMPPTGALKPEQVAIIKAWIDQGAEWPDAASGETPIPPTDPKTRQLLDASLRGDAKTVTQLLGEGVGVNAKNDAGATALMRAAAGLHPDIVRLLIDRGANVNAASDDKRTPLLIAAGIPGAAEVVTILLDHGADPSTPAPALGGDTAPITEAATSGDEAVFRVLIARGANVKAAGPAALGLALRAQCMPCVEMLLKVMDKDAITGAMVMGGPPLGPALATPLLLERGGDVNARDDEGHTLLMQAAASDAMAVDAIAALMAHGADVNAATPKGETALTYARQRGRTPVVDALVAAGAKDTPAAAPPRITPSPASSARAAVERSLPLLQQNDVTFLKKAGCVSCHNNTLTAVTVAIARAQGIAVNDTIARQQLTTIGDYIESWRERALQGIAIPGDSDTVSYILLGLAAEQYPPDAATDAMAQLLKRQQTPAGNWRIFAHRPPLESSDVEVTAASMHALQVYAPKDAGAGYQQAIARAANWIAKATPMSTEERAFQLLGLGWSGAGRDAKQNAARQLVAEQRPDGGWAQIPTLASDAYATGQALVALRESGAAAVTDPAFKRGVAYLMQTQCADGSWFVHTRAFRIQPHFESGFPYGMDQFISAAATNWATRALALASVKTASANEDR